MRKLNPQFMHRQMVPMHRFIHIDLTGFWPDRLNCGHDGSDLPQFAATKVDCQQGR